MKRLAFLLLLSFPVVSLAGCITHAVRVEPITLEPVQVTMDVNLHVDDSRTAGGEGPESATPAAGGSSAAASPAQGPGAVTQQ
ncbi:MAG: hypothetical protein M3Y87_17685 [Myxococcota bacterium]|nr:hypothetical protein [Myxococcota bacterium]